MWKREGKWFLYTTVRIIRFAIVISFSRQCNAMLVEGDEALVAPINESAIGGMKNTNHGNVKCHHLMKHGSLHTRGVISSIDDHHPSLSFVQLHLSFLEVSMISKSINSTPRTSTAIISDIVSAS